MSAAPVPLHPPRVIALCGQHNRELLCPTCHPPPSPMPDRPAALYVSVAEAAVLVGLSFSRLRQALGEGLPSVVVGRRRLIKVAELEMWMDAHADGGWR